MLHKVSFYGYAFSKQVVIHSFFASYFCQHGEITASDVFIFSYHFKNLVDSVVISSCQKHHYLQFYLILGPIKKEKNWHGTSISDGQVKPASTLHHVMYTRPGAPNQHRRVPWEIKWPRRFCSSVLCFTMSTLKL